MKVINEIARKADELFASCEEKGFRTMSQEELVNATNVLLESLRDFESYFMTHSFSKKDEILCLKTIKPTMAGRAMFLHKLMIFEKTYIAYSGECHKRYYKTVLEEIQTFISDNQDLYLYFKSNTDDMDDLYFTRDNQVHKKYWNKLSLDCYSIFYTSHSKVYAGFICCELLSEFVSWRLSVLDKEESEFNVKQKDSMNYLRWTSSQVSLVELGYALASAGVINNGDVAIKEVLEALSFAFDAELGDYYRAYKDIEKRSNAKTKFLDKLKISLLNKIDSEK